MSLERKLKKWIEMELVTQEQASSILNFEKKDSNTTFWRSLYIFSGILIGLGICLIVASNWEVIPSPLKFSIDFIISLFFVWNAYKNIENRRKGLSELFLILSFLMIGATIGLTGQVFNLEGGWVSFAFFWAMLGIPFVVCSHSLFLNYSWLILFFHFFALECVVNVLQPIFIWISEIKFFQRGFLLQTLFVFIFYLMSFLMKNLDKNFHKYTILPQLSANLFLLCSYVSLSVIACLGLDIVDRFAKYFSIAFVFFCLGYRMWLGIKNKDAVLFKQNSIFAEIYIFSLFATKMGDLFASGLGFIFSGLFILLAIYILKKTSNYIKNMEMFQ